MKTKLFNALSLAVIMAMLLSSLALADNTQSDGDGVVPYADNNMAFGTVCAGSTTTKSAAVWIVRLGSGQVFKDGSTVTVSVLSTSGTGLSAAIGSPNSIVLPNNWGTIGNGTQSSAVFSTVTFVAGSVGAFSGSVTYQGSGTNSSNATINRNDTMLVTATVINCDTTPPVITPNISGTLGNNGWYTSDVNLTWSVSDPESSVTSTTGCGPSTLNADSAGQTFTCSATSAGGTASQSVTIKRDATAPGISFDSPPTIAWYNADVTANWSCSDALSGVVSASVSGSTSGEGAAQSATGTCEDNAGNTASDTQTFMVDKTAPSISGSAAPGANANGWNNTDVTVTFTCGDGLSGVASCGSDVTLSGEGSGQSATGTATDNAGNSASATVSGIKIDKTAPSVSASAAPAANGNGWNNSAVTVSFTGSDALSGIAECDSPVVLSSEGAGQSATGYCSDLAGNSASATASGINIDLTAPAVSLVGGPADDGVYYYGFVPAAPTCSASDALSGVASCAVSGYAANIGSHTVSADASDNAGNSASASASYTVLAWTLNGFYQPVDMNGVWNTVKGGSTVPLKFEIFAGTTELTSTSSVQSLAAYKVACTGGGSEDAIETVATGGTSLRYDSVSGQFIYNWQTPRKPGECYKVVMETKDGSKLTAFFKLK